VKELGWKFAGDVLVTGIAALLAVVAPTWWANVAGTVVSGSSLPNSLLISSLGQATGIDARNTMNSGFQYLEGLRKRECRYFADNVPLNRLQGFIKRRPGNTRQ
jgi:hypothetical protein